MAIEIKTGPERYREHRVWDTLELKLKALSSVHYDDPDLEQTRADVVEWLTEAQFARGSQPSSLYLSVLDELEKQLQGLKAEQGRFKQYSGQTSSQASISGLKSTLRQLPLPVAGNLSDSLVQLLDREVEVRNRKLDQLRDEFAETQEALQEAQGALANVQKQAEEIEGAVKTHRGEIKGITESAQATIESEWSAALQEWQQKRDAKDKEHEEEAAEHIAALGASAHLGGTLLDRAVGKLSAVEWSERAERDRTNATKQRRLAYGLFMLGGLILLLFTIEAIVRDAELSVGGYLLRTTVVLFFAGFGAAVLRESRRHFREADSSEEVATALETLAPFYENTDRGVRLKARQQVGEAVLVKNILSRFGHRDASKHGESGSSVNALDVLDEVRDFTEKARELKSAEKANQDPDDGSR